MRTKATTLGVTAAIEAMKAAGEPMLVAPAHVRLRERDEPFWASVIGARARSEWTKNDLVLAAQLARCQSDIEHESILLEEEGSLVIGKTGLDGDMVVNPRNSVLESLMRREMSLMRTLRIGGSAIGDKRNVDKLRQLEREATQAREEVQHDNLLAD